MKRNDDLRIHDSTDRSKLSSACAYSRPSRRALDSTLCQGLLVLSLLLGILTGPSRASDFWPLVKQAEGAVWGTVSTVLEGEEDRVLILAVDRVVRGSFAGPGPLHLSAPGAAHPDGTHLLPGAKGLFLYQNDSDPVFIQGGFLEKPFTTVDTLGIEALIDADSGTPVNSTILDRPNFSPLLQHALVLLESSECRCREVALQVLLSTPNLARALDSECSQRLRRCFLEERREQAQVRFLELFLLHQMPLASSGATTLHLLTSNSEVALVSRQYLVLHATVEDKARLLESFPQLTVGRRIRLLETFSEMQLPEATPFVVAALQSPHRGELEAAILALGDTHSASALPIYSALLASTDLEICKLAVRGLASLQSPAAVAQLQQLAESEQPTPIGAFARDVLRYPFRHSALRCKPTLRTRER